MREISEQTEDSGADTTDDSSSSESRGQADGWESPLCSHILILSRASVEVDIVGSMVFSADVNVFCEASLSFDCANVDVFTSVVFASTFSRSDLEYDFWLFVPVFSLLLAELFFSDCFEDMMRYV